MKISPLFLAFLAISEGKKGKHKKKKHSTEQVHFEAKEPYECVWDEQTWNVEACKIEEDDHHGHQRNEGHGGRVPLINEN